MKKIVVGILIFIIIFGATFVYFFPYSDYITNMVKTEVAKTKDITVDWGKSLNQFPKVLFDNLVINSKQGELIFFETFKVGLSPFQGVVFEGIDTKRGTTLKGNFKGDTVFFNAKNYFLPSFLRDKIGYGKFALNGSYNVKTSSGRMNFDGDLEKVPTSLISEPLRVTGDATKDGNNINVIFDAIGEHINGKGNISIISKSASDSQVSGVIQLKAGLIPIKITLSGTPDNIKMNTGL